MRTQAHGGHGHMKGSLAASIAQAVQNAMQGVEHDKVIVIVTGISENDGEYDVSVECIMIDNDTELNEDDIDYEKDKRRQEAAREMTEDFHEAEYDVENRPLGMPAEDGQHPLLMFLWDKITNAMSDALKGNVKNFEFYVNPYAEENFDVAPLATIKQERYDDLVNTHPVRQANTSPLPG